MSLASITSPDSNLLPNVVAGLSILATSAGLFALIDPLEAIPSFGLKFPYNSERANMSLAVALTKVYGVRNLSMGLVQLALWWNARKATGATKLAWRHALGWALVLNVATPVVDGLVCEAHQRNSGWRHWIFAPVSAAIGAGLLLQL